MSSETTDPDTDTEAGTKSSPGPYERPHPEGRRNKQGIRIDPRAEAEEQPRRAVLSALVKHEPGVLAKVAGLFARRQFNIEGLSVGPTTDDSKARITLAVIEPEPGIEQVKKQLRKLVPVIDVTEVSGAVERELALIKVDAEDPDKVQAVAEMHGGDVVDVSTETITVEVTGDRGQIDGAIDTFERFDIKEIVRTGSAALTSGAELTAGNGHGY
ncbi:MAG: acetolactate synthase small subunit [Halobacteriales archaeon]